MPDKIGQLFGNYRIVRLLGTGGFAEVWLGQHIHLDTFAALKILLHPLDTEEQAMFLREAKVIAAFSHQNIVRVFDSMVVEGIPVIVMEFAQHGTLRTKHPRGQAVPLNTVISYVKQIALALDHAHSTGVIRRDIKPAKMLVGVDGRISLSDFGIVARIHNEASMQTGKHYAGTYHYSAPEQISGNPCPASDQYALAIAVYEWLTGNVPFTGTFTDVAMKHLTEVPQAPIQRNPLIRRSVNDVIMKALAKDPQHRFGSVSAFAEALEQAMHSQPVVAASTQTTTKQIKPKRLIYQLKLAGGATHLVWSPDGTRLAAI